MNAELRITYVQITNIFTGAKRRALTPKWIVTLAESMSAIGLVSPIEVVLDGSGYLLVSGAHRLAAAKQLGWEEIPCIVKSAEDLQSATQVKVREIAENLIRNNLSALDRAFDIAEWRSFYEATHEVAKRGRPKKMTTQEWEEKISADFALNFSDAAQLALNISRRTVFHHLKIASIGEDMRQRLSLHAIADNQSELLAFAAENPMRRELIADMLTAEPQLAASVAAATALIDMEPAEPKLERWQKVTNVFAALKEKDQYRFFDANQAAVMDWLEARKAR